MEENNHNTKLMVTIAAMGAGMMALYPLSHATGILGLSIFTLVIIVELF